jgi:hypothetical protein
MKKIIISIALVAIILGIFVVFNGSDTDNTASVIADYKNIEYSIEGKLVKLEGDTRYFGNELKTDLNNDGREDIVFLVTQSPGGSGTFYYAVAALNTPNGYVGSDGYFLGDRIAPQTTELSQNPRHKNVVVINYADRALSEPMTAKPTVGKSAYLKLDAASMRWAIVVPDFEGESR